MKYRKLITCCLCLFSAICDIIPLNISFYIHLKLHQGVLCLTLGMMVETPRENKNSNFYFFHCSFFINIPRVIFSLFSYFWKFPLDACYDLSISQKPNVLEIWSPVWWYGKWWPLVEVGTPVLGWEGECVLGFLSSHGSAIQSWPDPGRASGCLLGNVISCLLPCAYHLLRCPHKSLCDAVRTSASKTVNCPALFSL